jgi:hypothetical protein
MRDSASDRDVKIGEMILLEFFYSSPPRPSFVSTLAATGTTGRKS